MAVHILRKRDLSKEQAQHLETRPSTPGHEHDENLQRVWDTTSYQDNLLAVLETTSNVPIGTIYRAGLPHEVDAAWWIDSLYRDKGLGSEMIDALARLLHDERATTIGAIRINMYRGQYNDRSSRLKARLKTQLAELTK